VISAPYTFPSAPGTFAQPYCSWCFANLKERSHHAAPTPAGTVFACPDCREKMEAFLVELWAEEDAARKRENYEYILRVLGPEIANRLEHA